MARIKENIKFIAVVVPLLVVFAGSLWTVWGMEQQIQENTDYRLQDQLDRNLERLGRLKARCGEGAVKCGEDDKGDYRRWRIRQQDLEKALGYRKSE